MYHTCNNGDAVWDELNSSTIAATRMSDMFTAPQPASMQVKVSNVMLKLISLCPNNSHQIGNAQQPLLCINLNLALQGKASSMSY